MPIDCHQCGKNTSVEELYVAHTNIEGHIDPRGPRLYLCRKCAVLVAIFLLLIASVTGPAGNIVERLIVP